MKNQTEATERYLDIVNVNVNQKLKVVCTWIDGSKEPHYGVFDSQNPPSFLYNIKHILCNSEIKFMTYQIHTMVVTITRFD